MNANIGGETNIKLEAEIDPPDTPVARVEFFDDNKLVGSVTQAPFSVLYHPATPKLNFCITARMTDTTGKTLVSPPITCVATSTVQRRYKLYDYEEKVGDKLKQVRLCIPEGLTTVRGILVVTNCLNGDSRDYYKEAWYGEFLFLHDFAFLGAQGDPPHASCLPVMQHALAQFAKNSQHPELVNAPYATTGFSSGGGFASYLLVNVPDRVIASVPVCARLNFTGVTPSAANLHTPSCIISGELEKFEPVVEPVLEAFRPNGAMFGWATAQGCGHGRVGQEVLAMSLLDTAVRLRYPADGDVRKGPLTLKPIDPNNGWVADNTTWKTGLTSISPAKQFKGNIGKSSWLPTEDIAFVYRAYATYDKPLTIFSPSLAGEGQVFDPGSNITIMADVFSFPDWKKLEFYDGARLLGKVTQGLPRLPVMNLTTGFHVFSVLGTDAQGTIRTSNPVLVIVRKLPMKN